MKLYFNNDTENYLTFTEYGHRISYDMGKEEQYTFQLEDNADINVIANQYENMHVTSFKITSNDNDTALISKSNLNLSLFMLTDTMSDGQRMIVLYLH